MLSPDNLEMGLGKRLQMSENTTMIMDRLRGSPEGEGTAIGLDGKDGGGRLAQKRGQMKAPIEALQGQDQGGREGNWQENFFD